MAQLSYFQSISCARKMALIMVVESLLVMLSVLFSYNVLPPLGSSSMLTSCCILSRCAGVEVATLPSEVALIDQEAEQQKSKQSALRSVHCDKVIVVEMEVIC